jgi:hypothetical protein
MVYDRAKIQISSGVLSVTKARIIVSNGNHNNRTIDYSAGSLPSNFLWDGAWRTARWQNQGATRWRSPFGICWVITPMRMGPSMFLTHPRLHLPRSRR